MKHTPLAKGEPLWTVDRLNERHDYWRAKVVTSSMASVHLVNEIVADYEAERTQMQARISELIQIAQDKHEAMRALQSKAETLLASADILNDMLAQERQRIAELEAQLADANKSLQAIADFQHMMFGADGGNDE